jgi:putative ABC transport system permease protein
MTWWRRVFSRNRLESQLDAELREHFDRLVRDFGERGHSDSEARRLARLEFGGMDQVKEACRDQRGTRWIDDTLQDVRYGLRGFRRQPGFAAVAILTLAIGVGANLTVFTLVDALLLRPLPVPDAAGLVTLTRWLQGNASEHFSYPQVTALSERADLFASVAGVGSASFQIGPAAALESVGGAWVSGHYFRTLQLVPAAGRLLSDADDRPGAAPAAVISYDFWMRRFGGATDAIGMPAIIEGRPVPIVGVTPRGFLGATVGERADITMAINAMAALRPEENSRTTIDSRWIRILARPAASLSREQVQSRLDVAWPQILDATTRPNMAADARKRALSMTLTVEEGRTGTSTLRRDLAVPLTAALALVTLVLVIACVNVANLLLARGATRTRELSLRLAIGAARGRIVRQLLVESALLAVTGAAAGLAIAWTGSAALAGLIEARAVGPDGDIAFLDVAPNLRIVAATITTAIVTALGFGIVPAWRASAVAPGTAVPSTRVAESHGRFGGWLIVAQVSLSLVIVFGAGLFTRSLQTLRAIDRGFEPGSVLLVGTNPIRSITSLDELVAFNQSLLRQVETLPGVGAASLAAMTPLQGGGMSQPMTVNGVPTGLDEIYFNIVAPRYFDIVGTPIVKGRDLGEFDDTSAPLVAVVNQAFARKYLEGLDPLGQRVRMSPFFTKTDMTIVGVVKDAVYESLRAPAPPTLYASYLQVRGRPMNLVLDARSPVAELSAAVRRAIQPRVPASPLRVRTLAAQVDNHLFEERLLVLLTSIFGALALTLAAIGVYGLMSFGVTTRTREIGIRLALGARPGNVTRLVLVHALRMVAIGVAIGLPLAWLASRFISRLTFGVQPTDVPAIASAIAILVSVGIAAAAIPARRAAAVDPVTSIHVE